MRNLGGRRARAAASAGILFALFLLAQGVAGSESWQTEWEKTVRAAKAGNPVNSLRTDIPKDMIPPEDRLKEGVSCIEAETPERMSMEPVLKLFNEALAEAERRKRER